MIEKKINNSKIILLQGDITQESTDAIVNAANPTLMGGGGVDGAIHRGGGPQILMECKKIRQLRGELPTGEAVITTAGNLKARYIIHTVGPILNGGHQGESELLASCYRQTLRIAAENSCNSIAFPSISTGAYGYPVKEAALVALKAVIDFLNENSSIFEVRFVLFDTKTFNIYNSSLGMYKHSAQIS